MQNDQRHEPAGFVDAFAAQGTTLRAALVARGELGPGDSGIPGHQHCRCRKAERVLLYAGNRIVRSLGDFVRLHERRCRCGAYRAPWCGPRGHLYGTNAEAVGPGALDPSINTFDLGDDPLAWAKERTATVLAIINDLPRHVLTDNASPNEVTAAYGNLMGEYARSIAPAVKYISGAYINPDHTGDPNARPPFAPIPKAKQKEALDLLVDRVLAKNALTVPAPVLQQMGPIAGSISAATRPSTGDSTIRIRSRR